MIIEMTLVNIFLTFLLLEIVPHIYRFRSKFWYKYILGLGCIPCFSIRASILAQVVAFQFIGQSMGDAIYSTLATYIFLYTISIISDAK